jgi:protein-tyrosine phosphatase
MITEVSKNLWISDIEGCKRTDNSAIIHAAKHPCFERIVGAVNNQHPHYLFLETENDLYLNMIDPEEPLFYKETFDVALKFIEKNIEKHKVILHCNEGFSRSASIAMLYLFKEISYRDAQEKFVELYPYYNPSYGIDWYMKMNWNSFRKEK